MVYKTTLQLLQNSFRTTFGSLYNFSIIHTTEREREREREKESGKEIEGGRSNK